MTRENIYNKFFSEEEYEKVNPENKEIIDDFMLELRQNKKSEGTIYQYSRDLKGFAVYVLRFQKNKNFLKLVKKDFRNYSLYLTEECKVSSARHNRLLSAIRSMLTYIENEDDYDYQANVARKVKGLSKEPVREIFFLSDEQIMKLKEELLNRKEYQKATLLLLSYDSAGRKAELHQVKKYSFLDNDKSNTNKVIGKRRKVFSLVYFSKTKECAKLWLEQRGIDEIESMWVHTVAGIKSEASKENIYQWFMEIKDILTEIEGNETEFNVHSLRHSALQNYSSGTHYVCQELGMMKGFPIEKLKLIANHENIDTTQHYLKDNSVDELAEMFNIKIT